jgi:hypothetical protein
MTNEFTDDPTDRKYKFQAKVILKKQWVSDVNIQGHQTQYESNLCLLVPEKSDQGVSFLNAWLPELAHEKDQELTQDNRRELGLYIAPPIDGPCRGAVMRSNYNYYDHHIVVMSVGVEEEFIKKNLNGKSIWVTALSSKDEGEADFAKDTSSEIRGS